MDRGRGLPTNFFNFLSNGCCVSKQLLHRFGEFCKIVLMSSTSTANVEIFVVTIFHKLNFHGDKLSWVRVAHLITVTNSSSVQIFVGLIFVGVACP